MSQFTPFFEGLITKQTPIALPPSASDCLINFDVDELGLLSKRKGTVISPVQYRTFFSVKSVSSVDLLVAVEGTDITVYSSDMSNVVFSIPSLYNGVVEDLYAFDVNTVDYSSVVIVGQSVNPVQVFIQYKDFTLLANQTVKSIKLPNWNTAQTVLIYDNVILPATVTPTVGEPDSIDFTVTPEPVSRNVTALHFAYGVWFNSQYYFGEELFRAISRGDTKVEQVPSTLLTQLDDDTTSFIKAYVNNSTQYVYTAQPRYYNEFYFSDGQSYTYDTTDSIAYSPYFMSFGQPVFEREIDLKREYFDVPNNLFRYNNHGLSNFVVVRFKNQAPSGITLNTEYVVTEATADTFKLTGATITNQFNTTQPSISVRSSAITSTGDIRVSGISNMSKPEPYVVNSSALLPAALVSGKKYWVQVTSNVMSVYFDASGQYKLLFSLFKTLTFTATDVNVATDVVTINGHGWANAIPVAIISATAPTGMVVRTTYYTYVVDANSLKFCTDSLLTTFVDLTAASGDYVITEDWGTWLFSPEYTSGSLEVVNKRDVLLLRARKLKLGKVASSIRVLVDNVLYTRSTSAVKAPNRYYVSDGNFNILTGAYDENDYINFGATSELGLSRTAFVQLINVRKFANMNAGFTPGSTYNNVFALNTVITVYGYADKFDENNQPTTAALIQNRVVLASSNTILLSNLSDSFINKQYYNNFSVDDRLTGSLAEPFSITLSDASSVRAIIEYQNAMLVFTNSAVYRIINLTYNEYVVLKVANQGVDSRKCVTELHSLIVYYNKFGVYTLRIEVQDTYYASELSISISNVLTHYTPILLEFIREDNKLVAVSSERIFVLNTRSGKWVEYVLPWNHAIISAFQINDELSFVDSAVSAVYTFKDTLLDLEHSITNSGDTLSIIGNAIAVNGTPVLPVITVGNGSKELIPFCDTYYDGSAPVPLTELDINYITHEAYFTYTSIERRPVFQVDDLPLNTLPVGAWATLRVGYAVQAVVISACTKAANLSNMNQVLMLEIVFLLSQGANACHVGVIYGNHNKPVWLQDALSSEVPTSATFVTLKEALQGVSSSYRVIIASDGVAACNVSGYAFLERSDNAPTYYSGGI